MKSTKAFTFIELLAVLTIVVILGATVYSIAKDVKENSEAADYYDHARRFSRVEWGGHSWVEYVEPIGRVTILHHPDCVCKVKPEKEYE